MTETHLFLALRSLDKSENPADERSREQLRDKIIGEKLELADLIVCRVFPSLGLNANNDLDDIKSEAALALIQAVDKFDPEFGVPFNAYANIRIALHLRHYARENGGLIDPRNDVDVETGFVEDMTGAAQDFSSDLAARMAFQSMLARAYEQVEAHLATERDAQSWARQKRAIDLSFFKDQTLLAVALDLGISPEAAKKVLKRGFDRLRPYLATLLDD